MIKSLNKAEKRNFKLYATRAGSTVDSKFIQLFNVLDRLPEPNDAQARKKMGMTAGQYSNLKRHLYQQLLTSLRLIFINKEIDIELREQLDFTRILYGKGHYLDALRTLERAKAKAVEHNQDLLHLEILEFQKLIEARHITLSRQIHNKMDLLLNESAERSYSVLNTSELFNLNIQIHGRYIENGHSRSPEEAAENEEFWKQIQTRRVDRETITSTFHQKINRFQAAMWYHYIQLNFTDGLEASLNAYTLFKLSPQMVVKDPDLYLRCLYYVVVFSFLDDRADLVRKFTGRLEDFLANEDILLNENSQFIGRIYRELARYNLYFITDNVDRARALSIGLQNDYLERTFVPNDHRWGLFLYKAAIAAFLDKDYGGALDNLNDIINMKGGTLREDLLINARLLHVLCNFELGHHSLVDYHLTNLSRLLRRSRESAEVHRIAVTGLRRLLRTPPAETAQVYESLDEAFSAVADHPFERKALKYLNLIQWTRIHLPETAPSAGS
ncbi:hypothetical protein [Lewinella sp. W8]|uniref:hypothetical protein n=1 Tax=Lewinella sp. W8 TaxID=2528208 RepID=UPI00106735D0|nr:hypothetical protein [Lewinella sp. W8]MTB51380.1 hypothetical protein [Lewinella sp. W8]